MCMCPYIKDLDDEYASSKYYWCNKGSHLPIEFVQRQKMERSLQNGTKTGHVAQSESLNLLWHRMAKIDPPVPVKRPEMSRWREPLVSGAHGGLACVRVPGSDPGRMCESMHASMGHIRGSLSDSQAARAFVTGVCCAWVDVYYNHCAKLCPIVRVLCAYAWQMQDESGVCLVPASCAS